MDRLTLDRRPTFIVTDPSLSSYAPEPVTADRFREILRTNGMGDFADHLSTDHRGRLSLYGEPVGERDGHALA